MLFKNSLAASGYIVSLFGGGCFAYDYFQDKTIVDLLEKLSTTLLTKEQFQNHFSLLKKDPKFIEDINALNSTDDEQGGNLLKFWCNKNFGLELNEENIKKVLPKVKRYLSKYWELFKFFKNKKTN